VKKIIIAALSILFALVPAIASADGRWQWDMSLEDVAKALGVSAASAERAPRVRPGCSSRPASCLPKYPPIPHIPLAVFLARFCS